MFKREEIRIRDPFVLPDRERGCYFLYGTTALQTGWIGAAGSFSVYRTTDLEHFSKPKTIIRDRDLTHSDFVTNANELFAGQKPTVLSRKPGNS